MSNLKQTSEHPRCGRPVTVTNEHGQAGVDKRLIAIADVLDNTKSLYDLEFLKNVSVQAIIFKLNCRKMCVTSIAPVR